MIFRMLILPLKDLFFNTFLTLKNQNIENWRSGRYLLFLRLSILPTKNGQFQYYQYFIGIKNKTMRVDVYSTEKVYLQQHQLILWIFFGKKCIKNLKKTRENDKTSMNFFF